MKQIIQISIIGLFAVLLSCESKQKEKPVSVKKEELRFPTIIDTSGFQTSIREASWLSTANYELLYIGEWKDTIYPDYTLKFYPMVPPPPPPPGIKFDPSDTIGFHKKNTEHKMYPYYVDWKSHKTYNSWSQAKLLITVDTMQKVKNDDLGDNWNSIYFEAYPVLIENNSTDTIRIGYGHFLPLITEAKDSTDTWKPIEKEWIYTCTNGVGSIILPPNEIGLSATMIYHGSYPTTIRLRIADSFSNEFKGKINYRQFESMFNEDGDYKEEYKQEMNK